MALSEAQKTQVRKWLCIPDLWRYLDTRFESVIANLSATAEAEVVAILAELVTVDAAIGTFLITTAGLKRADEVEWYPGSKGMGSAQIEALMGRGRMLCSRLSTLTGVPLLGDAFGKQGYGGDWWMGPSFQGSGGLIGLG